MSGPPGPTDEAVRPRPSALQRRDPMAPRYDHLRARPADRRSRRDEGRSRRGPRVRRAAQAPLGPGSAALSAVCGLRRPTAPSRLRPLVREVAAGAGHLFRAVAELPQARLRGIPDLARARRTVRDALGLESELDVGQRRQGGGLARALDAGLLRRASSDHRLRHRTRLLPVLGKGSSALVGSAPSTWVTFWFRDWGHLAMPAFALGWYFSGAMLRITRSGMLDVLGSDYIKLVRLKGVPEPMVVAKHALKNSLIPVLTFAGLNLLVMVNVSVVIEVIFNWPGVGQLLYDALSNRDFPMVQGVVLMSGLLIVLLNFTIDVLYGYVDPRIRLSR